jgi:hypothetical protein
MTDTLPRPGTPATGGRTGSSYTLEDRDRAGATPVLLTASRPWLLADAQVAEVAEVAEKE